MDIKINKEYKHLSFKERELISSMFNFDFSMNKIASILNRSPSTISRELKRNKNSENIYLANTAQDKALLRYKNKYLCRFKRKDYIEYIKIFLLLYDKCTHGIKTTVFFIKKYYPKLRSFCFKTIYNWVNSGKWILKVNDKLHPHYVRGRKRKDTFQKKKSNGTNFLTNSWRNNDKINNKNSIGHYEVDLIMSSNKYECACLLTIVERYSRLAFAIKIPNKNQIQIYKALINWRNKFKSIPLYSMTVDNGQEFKLMPLIAKKLKIATYYTEPYASFQKGSNENFNGIIRRKWKKETNFDEVSQMEIDKYVNLINSMPREILNWKTAKEKFIQCCKE